MKNNSLINKIKSLLVSSTGTNPEWAEAIALAVIAGVIGRKFIFPLKKGIYLHIYIITICTSGISKTLPLDYHINPTLDHLHVRFSDKFTVEGFTEEINGYNLDDGSFIKGKDSGILVIDEIFSLIKGDPIREGNLSFLLKLWSSSTFSNQTRKNKKERVPITSISILGGSTKHILHVIKEEHFIMGLLNRILWVDFGLNSLQPETEDDYFFDDQKSKKIEKEDNEIQLILKKLRNIKAQNVKLIVSKRAMILFTRKAEELKLTATNRLNSNDLDFLASYLLHARAQLAKLSGLYAISRQYTSIIKGNSSINVQEEDIKLAVKFLRNRIRDFKKVHDGWLDRNSKTQRGKYEKSLIIRHIKEKYSPGELISLNNVRKALGMDYAKVQRIVKSISKTDKNVIRVDDKGKNNKYYVGEQKKKSNTSKVTVEIDKEKKD